jgi:RimJ/RimL family protein N-acetyltransferase
MAHHGTGALHRPERVEQLVRDRIGACYMRPMRILLRKLSDERHELAIQRRYSPYEVFQRYRRRGIARAAVSALITHLFQDASIHRVCALVDTRNQSSWQLLEALRFRRIAMIENADPFKGERSDEYSYELRREYQK